MTSFEHTLTITDRFVDAAAAVCAEARRLGALCTTVILLHEDETIAMTVDDDADRRAYDLQAVVRSLRAHVLPTAPPLIAPLVSSRGWFGAIVNATLGPVSPQFERAFAMLATHRSVWCTDHGIGAVPKAIGNDQLGPRQRQIAELAARGLTNDEIAADLGISVNTVKGRLKEVFEILEVRNRTELVHVLRLLAPRQEVPCGTTKVSNVTVTRAS